MPTKTIIENVYVFSEFLSISINGSIKSVLFPPCLKERKKR